MRQWHVNPALMCDQHLLGEHVEHHMMVGSIRAGKKIAGHVSRGQIETDTIASRHDELVAEMVRRGMRHRSPIDVGGLEIVKVGAVDRAGNLVELARRCPRCRQKIEDFRYKTILFD
jgi:hypothetical protein